ncbi:MAG: cytidylate kinase-like family protein [Desulfobacula sp.]|nr:cytidylate kinase-like family protein [Desulfobacula sp.]
MPVLIFTSDNKDFENKIAKQIAQKLEYTTLSLPFLNEVADKYVLDRDKLAEAMKITPSILKRMPSKTWRYFLSCVEVEVLNRLLKDNIVCWGLAAQLYVVVVSHVLKVRLIGGHGNTEQTAGAAIDIDRARKVAAEHEQKRDKWSMAAFNRKESNPELYDMVINMDQIQPGEIVETIVTTLGYPRFKAMTYSKTTLADKALAAMVKNVLLKTQTDIHVHSQNGTVVVTTTSIKREKNKKIDLLEVNYKIRNIEMEVLSFLKLK